MEDVGSDMFIISRQPFAGSFIEHYQTGSVRSSNPFVGVIDTVRGVQIEMVSAYQNGTVGRVMRPNAYLGNKIELPDDVRVHLARLDEFSVNGRM
jgi:hypothetical protein